MTNKKFYIIIILNIVAILAAIFAVTYSVSTNKNKTNLYNYIPQTSENLKRDEKLSALPSKNGDSIPSLAPILKEKTAAIVNISTKGKVEITQSPFFQNPFFQDPFFERFFKFNVPQLPLQRETQSIGSGVIVDAENGYILTNHHVIKDADEIYVTLLDKRQLEAKLIGSDSETDIAVLQVKADNLHPLPLGTSSTLEVGDFVVAIGNPFGLGHTVTSGIVSALERSSIGIVEGYENFIQTDASINPGNSGGALINLRGEMVGINTAIVSKNGGNVGIGFAIPVDMARGVMKQLIEHGEVKRGQLGVHIQDITPDITEAMDVDINEGALVASVVENSAAEEAGIKTGDIVISLNGQKIKNANDLKNKIGAMRIGDEAKLVVLRKREQKAITVKIGERTKISSKNDGIAATDIELLKGAEFKEGEEGVIVAKVSPNTPAFHAGLRAGDLILSVNQESVKTPDELFNAAKKKKKGILINLRRGNASMFIVIN